MFASHTSAHNLGQKVQAPRKQLANEPMPPDHDAAMHFEAWLEQWESWACLAQQILDQLRKDCLALERDVQVKQLDKQEKAIQHLFLP